MYLSPPTTVPRFAPLLDAVLVFDGVDDVVVAHPRTPPLDQGFTILFWMDVTDLVDEGRPAGVLGIAGDVVQGATWRVEASDTAPPALRVGYAGTEVLLPLAELKNRVFVSTVYDADAMCLAVTANTAVSTIVYRASAADPIQGDTVPLTIGHTGVAADGYFPGVIALVRLFDRPLSAAECAYAMHINEIGSRTQVHGLVGEWRLNEGYGPVAFDYARLPGARGALGNGNPDAVPDWKIAAY